MMDSGGLQSELMKDGQKERTEDGGTHTWRVLCAETSNTCSSDPIAIQIAESTESKPDPCEAFILSPAVMKASLQTD